MAWLLIVAVMAFFSSCQGQFEQASCPKIKLAYGNVVPLAGPTGYQDGDKVTFSCFPGYELLGENELTCSSFWGGWRGLHPVCVLVQGNCYHPGSASSIVTRMTTSGDAQEFEEVEVHDVILKDEVVYFKCNQTHKMVLGEVTQAADYVHEMRCLPDGTWGEPLPTCTESKECPHPKFENGDVSRTVIIDNVLTYVKFTAGERILQGDRIGFQCNPDKHMVVGEDKYISTYVHQVTCPHNGEWGNLVPYCEDTIKECPHPTFENGHLSLIVIIDGVSTDVNITAEDKIIQADIIKFQCKPEYQMVVGENHYSSDYIHQVACPENGMWGNLVPSCKQITPECPHPRLQNGFLFHMYNKSGVEMHVKIKENDFILAGDMISFRCEVGYRIKIGENWQPIDYNHKAQCLPDGTWPEVMPSCEGVKECPHPTFENGHLSRTIIEDVSTDAKVTAEDKILQGDIIKFQCKSEYQMLVGDNHYSSDYVHQVACPDNGMWGNLVPSCKQIRRTCVLPIYENGRMIKVRIEGENIIPMKHLLENTVITPNEVIQFDCNTGYQIHVDGESVFNGGVIRLSCQDDGSWDQAVPICQRFTCSEPPSGYTLELASPQKSTYFHGDTVEYKCINDQYELLGPHSLTCRMDLMSWFPHLPTCRLKRCPVVYSPEDGWFGRKDKEQLIADCNSGFFLNGSRVRSCLENGTWSGTPATCQTSDSACPNLGYPDGGSLSRTVEKAGHTVRFLCLPGFILVGQEYSVCNENHQWSAPLPKCLGPNEYSDPENALIRWKEIVTKITDENAKDMDHQVFFMLDSSGSISAAEMNAQRSFFGHIATKLSNTRMSLLAFNSSVVQVANNTLTAGIHRALRENSFTSGGGTRLRPAFKYAKKGIRKSIILILNGAINEGGSLTNVMRKIRWANNTSLPDLYVITLGAFPQRRDLISAASHHKAPLDHLFFLKSERELNILTNGIRNMDQ